MRPDHDFEKVLGWKWIFFLHHPPIKMVLHKRAKNRLTFINFLMNKLPKDLMSMRSHYAVNAIKSTRVSLQRDFLRASMLKVNLMTQHGVCPPWKRGWDNVSANNLPC